MATEIKAEKILTKVEIEIAARTLAKIDFATEIAEIAGTSVVISATDMRAVLEYVEQLVAFYNKNNSIHESNAHDRI